MSPLALRTLFATLCLFAAHAAFAQANLPFKVYIGKVGAYEITKGVNSHKINDGFLPTGTIPVSPTNTYRIKHGQALALLYQAKGQSETGATWIPSVPVNGFEKVIRKVDGQEIQMPNYQGVGVEFHNTWIGSRHDEYSIFRMQKSRFNPPLPKADFDRTHGIFVAQSGDAIAYSKEPAFARDVVKVAGKIMTAYYLKDKLDSQAFLTIEVDFTDVPMPAATTGKRASTSDAQSSANAQAQRDDRAAAQAQAAEDRAAAREQRDADKAAAKEARDASRAEAAAERARKRAEAAAARKAVSP